MAKRTKTDKSRLADLSQLTEEAQDITGRGKSKSFTLADAEQPAKEQEPGLTKKNRAKFTTMLRPDLREKLQNVADNHAISIADVLETIVEEYFEITGK